jgi:hypothetical protein
MKTAIKAALFAALLATGAAIGTWSVVVLLAGLRETNWQITELLRQYLIATGVVKPTHNLVDFYSHIKGIEYLICVAFFVMFPMFYRYLNKDVRRVETTH